MSGSEVRDEELVDRDTFSGDGGCGCAVPYVLQESGIEAYAFLVARGYVRGCATGCGSVRLDRVDVCGAFGRRVLHFADHISELADVGWRGVCDFGFAADPCSVAEDG